MASAQLTLAPRTRAVAGHSWLDSRDRWLASHRNVVRSCAVATRLRYDEGGDGCGAGLTVAVGAVTNLCSKIVSPATMSPEWGGATIGRTGRIVPEVIEELIGRNPIRAQSIGYIR